MSFSSNGTIWLWFQENWEFVQLVNKKEKKKKKTEDIQLFSGSTIKKKRVMVGDTHTHTHTKIDIVV
jgi:organic radical activating enzyme